MRTGRLKTPADLLNESGSVIATQMIGIAENEETAAYEPGLLKSARITLRARYYTAIVPGRYFRTLDGRLFLVGNAVDPDSRQQDLVINARELQAPLATVNPGASAVIARCALLEYSTKPGDGNGLLPAEQRRRAEFCNAEYHPQVGHEFLVAGSRYRITEIDTDGTTAVVTRVWVQFLNHE